MQIPSWAQEMILNKIAKHPGVDTGKVLLITEFDYFKGGLGTVKIKISHEECHRPSDFLDKDKN